MKAQLFRPEQAHLTLSSFVSQSDRMGLAAPLRDLRIAPCGQVRPMAKPPM